METEAVILACKRRTSLKDMLLVKKEKRCHLAIFPHQMWNSGNMEKASDEMYLDICKFPASFTLSWVLTWSQNPQDPISYMTVTWPKIHVKWQLVKHLELLTVLKIFFFYCLLNYLNIVDLTTRITIFLENKTLLSMLAHRNWVKEDLPRISKVSLWNLNNILWVIPGTPFS